MALDDHAHLTNAPAEVEVAGKVLKFSPLTLRDLGRFERWVRSIPVQIASSTITGPDSLGMSDADKQLILKQAYVDAASRRVTDESSIMPYLNSVEGAVKFTHLALFKEHPNLSIEEYQGLIGMDFDLIDRIANIVVKLTGLDVPEEPDAKAEGSGKKEGASV